MAEKHRERQKDKATVTAREGEIERDTCHSGSTRKNKRTKATTSNRKKEGRDRGKERDRE